MLTQAAGKGQGSDAQRFDSSWKIRERSGAVMIANDNSYQTPGMVLTLPISLPNILLAVTSS
jgi:hypothetical protein